MQQKTFDRLFSELRHRRVFRSVAGYAVIAWIAVEACDVIFPALGVPDAVLTGLIIVALAGFPLVAILAWVFDITPEGVVRGGSQPSPSMQPGRLSLISSWILVSLLVVAVAYLSVRLYWQTGDGVNFHRGKSVAVLPFKDIAADDSSNNAYFSEGVAEAILSGLSNVDGLRVAARTSSFAYRDNVDVREIGEILNVSTVLEGSVRIDPESGRVRITAQLAETKGGFQIWTNAFDYELQNVFAAQDAIALSIVDALELEFSQGEEHLVQAGTANVEAYRNYLQGRHLLQEQSVAAIDQAIEKFTQATTLDPQYAQAYAGLADAWISKRKVGNLSLLAATQRAHDAISIALRLNNQLAEAQTSLGLCVLGAGQQAAAATQFAKAIELDPDNVDAHLQRANLLRDRGYLDDAMRAYNLAVSIDPLNTQIVAEQAILMAMQGRYDDAFAQLEESLAEDPLRLTVVLAASKVAALSGDPDRSLRLARDARSESPENPIVLTRLADAHLQLGELSDAKAILELAHSVTPDNEAVIDAWTRYLFAAGQYEELQVLTQTRAQFFLDSLDLRNTTLRLDRLAWAALGELTIGDSAAAAKLLESAIPESAILDPNPDSIHYVSLLAKSRVLTKRSDDDVSAALEQGRILVRRAQSQGWRTGDIDFGLARLAAVAGLDADALQHLGDAIDRGWRGHLFAAQDPTLASLRSLPEFDALISPIADR